MDIWHECKGVKHVTLLKGTAWRIVEAQHVTSTRKLVDSLEEQELLEDIIESSKPPLGKGWSEFHPLLYTSFRYPPLKYGSRFGHRFENSLWYGSLKLDTAMIELAFMRFNFLRAVKTDFDIVDSLFTVFSAQVETKQGVHLTRHPFSKFTSHISSPVSYQESQKLGTAMRQADIEAFFYQSSRDPEKGTNVGLFTPKAFLNKKPNSESFQTWQCSVTEKVVEFVRSSVISIERKNIPIELFLVNGKLPFLSN